MRGGSETSSRAGQRSTSAREARFELDARERCPDADVDASAERDVLGGIRAGDIERLRRVKDTWIAVRGTEQQGDLLATRDLDATDLDTVLEHPALEQLQRRVVAQELLDRLRRRHGAFHEAVPLDAFAHERTHAVPERVDGRLVPSIQEDDDGRHYLGVRQVLAVDARLHEPRYEIVVRRASPLGDELEREVAECLGGRVRSACLLLGRVELVHLHHRVRPVEEVAVPVDRHSEPLADECDREGLRELVDHVEACTLDQRVEQLARELRGRLTHRFDAPGRERRSHELANTGVVGRLEPEQAPALHVPESRPARIERLGLELGVGSDVPEVPSETLVTKACANVGVAGNEPAVELAVVEHGRRLAELSEHRIRVGQECRRPRIELHDYSREPTYWRRPYTPSATSADAAMHRPMIPKTRPAVAMPPPPSPASDTAVRMRACLASASATSASTTVTGIAKPAWSRS